jgi:hypothetical protein
MQMHGIYLDQELLNEYFLSKKLMRKSMDGEARRRGENKVVLKSYISKY